MRHALSVLFFAAAAAVPTLSSAAERAAATPNVVKCARANIPANLNLRRVTLETTGKEGQASTIEGRIYAMREPVEGSGNGLLRAMLMVDAPEYLDGAAYLVRETNDFLRDGMFVYLPAVGRVRRVTGSFTDGSLMGSAFSYFEFKQLVNAFHDLTPKLIGDGRIHDRPAHIVRFQPLAGAETRYTAVKTWFDNKTCLPLRADFMQGDGVVKRLTVPEDAIAQTDDGQWYPRVIRMRVLATGSESVMRVDNVSLKEEPSQVYFDPETFHTVQ